MGVGRQVLQIVGRGESVVVICECRHCGTTMTGGESKCPTCGQESIAKYEIPQ